MKRKNSNASGFPEYAMMDLPTMEKEILNLVGRE
jgi:hypothetical protein